MDVLHKVNLPIFVEFQHYIAHTFGQNVYGKSIYDLTQADIEGGEDCHQALMLWLGFRTAWISGASRPNEGHDEPCYYCQMPCDGFAGNPSLWPIPLSHDDDPGVVKWHHTGCVQIRLYKLQEMEKLFARIDADYDRHTLQYIRILTGNNND